MARGKRDRAPSGATETISSNGGSSGVPQPSAFHEQLWAQILETIDERVDARMPIMATVRGKDGGNLRVLRDDEDEDRAVGYPRQLGSRRKSGDRVLLIPTRSGDPIVFGPISGGGEGAAERVVGNQDIEDNAIEGSVIRDGGITKGKLDKGLTDKIDSAATSDQVDKAEQRATAKADQAKNAADQASNKADQAANKADQAQSKANAAADSADLKALETKLQKWVKDNFEPKKKSGA